MIKLTGWWKSFDSGWFKWNKSRQWIKISIVKKPTLHIGFWEELIGLNELYCQIYQEHYDDCGGWITITHTKDIRKIKSEINKLIKRVDKLMVFA